MTTISQPCWMRCTGKRHTTIKNNTDVSMIVILRQNKITDTTTFEASAGVGGSDDSEEEEKEGATREGLYSSTVEQLAEGGELELSATKQIEKVRGDQQIERMIPKSKERTFKIENEYYLTAMSPTSEYNGIFSQYEGNSGRIVHFKNVHVGLYHDYDITEETKEEEVEFIPSTSG